MLSDCTLAGTLGAWHCRAGAWSCMQRQQLRLVCRRLARAGREDANLGRDGPGTHVMPLNCTCEMSCCAEPASRMPLPSTLLFMKRTCTPYDMDISAHIVHQPLLPATRRDCMLVECQCRRDKTVQPCCMLPDAFSCSESHQDAIVIKQRRHLSHTPQNELQHTASTAQHQRSKAAQHQVSRLPDQWRA